MYQTATFEGIPRPALFGLMVLGFILCWPVGLAALAILLWSGRMGCHWHHDGAQDWRQRMMEKIERKMERHAERHQRRWGSCGGGQRSSGNRAFDEYRADTIRRLEEEEKEFREFLDRLRFAKDKAEFDEFLNQRRNRPETLPDAPLQA